MLMPHRNPSPIDLFANDVWAVGAVLAFMLTADTLFDTNLPEEASVKQVINRVISKICDWVRSYMHMSIDVKSHDVVTFLAALLAIYVSGFVSIQLGAEVTSLHRMLDCWYAVLHFLSAVLLL